VAPVNPTTFAKADVNAPTQPEQLVPHAEKHGALSSTAEMTFNEAGSEAAEIA